MVRVQKDRTKASKQTFMPSHLETARSGLRARRVRRARNAPMLPTPIPSAPRLIIDICAE